MSVVPKSPAKRLCKGIAVNCTRAIIILRAQKRKRRAAAFTFQAAAPDMIPAQQGEAVTSLRIALCAIIIS